MRGRRAPRSRRSRSRRTVEPPPPMPRCPPRRDEYALRFKPRTMPAPMIDAATRYSIAARRWALGRHACAMPFSSRYISPPMPRFVQLSGLCQVTSALPLQLSCPLPLRNSYRRADFNAPGAADIFPLPVGRPQVDVGSIRANRSPPGARRPRPRVKSSRSRMRAMIESLDRAMPPT